MSKSFKYVSDFQFPSECGFTGSSGKTMVKGYARGGKPDMAHGGSHGTAKKAIANERAEMSRIKQETRSERKDAGQEMSRVRKEMRYDEAKLKSDRPMRKQYPTDRSEPMIKMMSGGMIKDRSKLGIEGNKNPGETKKHTAPDLPKPKTMMKSGGPVKKMAKGGAPKAGIANSPKLQAMTQMASQGAALAAQKNAASQQPMPRRPNPTQVNPARPKSPPPGAAQAAAQLQGAGAGASQSAIRNAQQNAANQQMNTSGPQLIRPGQPVSPPRGAAPVKTALGNTGGPRPAQTPAAPLSAKPMPGRINQPTVVGGRGARDDAPRGPIAKPNMAQRGGPGFMAKGGMTPKQEAKVGKVMGEFKAGDLHSGSKSGPMVKSRKQAVAIAMSEAGKKRK